MFVLYLSSLTIKILARHYPLHTCSDRSLARCKFIADVLGVALPLLWLP